MERFIDCGGDGGGGGGVRLKNFLSHSIECNANIHSMTQHLD